MLICPHGDYRVREAAFMARWNRFDADAEKVKGDEGFKLAEDLLKDLQEMNIKRGENETEPNHS